MLRGWTFARFLALLFAVACLAPAFSTTAEAASSPSTFIDTFLPYAKEQYKLYGIPVSVELAQGAYESGWALTRDCNSFFDITYVKGEVQSGPYAKQTSPCNAYPDHTFRTYTDARTAWLDYGYFMKTDRNYAAARQDLNNPRQFLIDEFCDYTWGPNAGCPPSSLNAILSVYDNYTARYGVDGNGGTAGTACQDGVTNLADTTAPIDALVKAGEPVTVKLRLKNTGSCTWGAGYSFTFSAAGKIPVPPPLTAIKVSPGTTADVSAHLRAPSVPGAFQGYWQLHNAAGHPFGPQIWLNLAVHG